ncbi:TetR/AcrR family transcriptional regulator [Kushneria sp. AK178]
MTQQDHSDAEFPADTTEAVFKGSQTTRERLYRAAIDAFAHQGFHGTKVSDIVAGAGVSQPTFYSYFNSKDAAYEALVSRFREGLQTITQHNLLIGHTPDESLQARVAVSFRRFLDYMAEDPALTEIGFFQPPGCSVTKAGMVEWVADNLRQEQAERLFRTDISAEHIARLLVGLLDQMGRLPCEPEERQSLAEVCAGLFCQGAGG